MARHAADELRDLRRLAVVRRHTPAGERSRQLMDMVPARVFMHLVYNILLHRDPDRAGLENFVLLLQAGTITRLDVLETVRASEEFIRGVPLRELLVSLHYSRCQFIQSLPEGRRILDLGGTNQSNVEGALIHLGYPYQFESLTIRDLDLEDRHDLYRHSGRPDHVDTAMGPVTYSYGSMADLSDFADGSVDLVYSGQSIEHVEELEADRTLAEVVRILSPGGHLALDTPNGPVCRLQTPGMINDDHKIEYSHRQFSAKLAAAGLETVEAKGLNYLGGPASTTPFVLSDVTANKGVFGAIEDCYLLAYVARKPGSPGRPA